MAKETPLFLKHFNIYLIHHIYVSELRSASYRCLIIIYLHNQSPGFSLFGGMISRLHLAHCELEEGPWRARAAMTRIQKHTRWGACGTNCTWQKSIWFPVAIANLWRSSHLHPTTITRKQDFIQSSPSPPPEHEYPLFHVCLARPTSTSCGWY